MSIGEKVRQARTNKDLSVYRLAELTGVTENHIHQIEKGITKNPGVVTLKKISNVLNVTLDELLGFEKSDKKVS